MYCRSTRDAWASVLGPSRGLHKLRETSLIYIITYADGIEHFVRERCRELVHVDPSPYSRVDGSQQNAQQTRIWRAPGIRTQGNYMYVQAKLQNYLQVHTSFPRQQPETNKQENIHKAGLHVTLTKTQPTSRKATPHSISECWNQHVMRPFEVMPLTVTNPSTSSDLDSSRRIAVNSSRGI